MSSHEDNADDHNDDDHHDHDHEESGKQGECGAHWMLWPHYYNNATRVITSHHSINPTAGLPYNAFSIQYDLYYHHYLHHYHDYCNHGTPWHHHVTIQWNFDTMIHIIIISINFMIGWNAEVKIYQKLTLLLHWLMWWMYLVFVFIMQVESHKNTLTVQNMQKKYCKT